MEEHCGDLLKAAREVNVIVTLIAGDGVPDLGMEVKLEISMATSFSVKVNGSVTWWWRSVGEGPGELRAMSGGEAHRRRWCGWPKRR